MWSWLDENNVVHPSITPEEVMLGMSQIGKRVAKTEFSGITVSTVFISLDHSYSYPRSLVFETMVFIDKSFSDDAVARYSTWDEAVIGHQKMVDEYTHTRCDGLI